MAQSILDDLHSPVYPTTTYHPWNDRCDRCLHWTGRGGNSILATVGAGKVIVGQCLGQEEDDRAPFADLDNGAEAFVFTPANGRCKAFAEHPDISAEESAIAATDHELNLNMARAAWAGV